MKSRVFLAAAAAGLACVQVWAAPPDPWTKVPALPTACYASQDKWPDRNNAAIQAVQLDHARQNDINAAIGQKATSADPMVAAARLQQQMMADPQNAQKYIEQMMQQTRQAQTQAPAHHAKEQQLQAESRTLMKQYQAALAKAMAPTEARWTALKKKAGFDPGAMSPSEGASVDWVKAEWHAILKERDKAYVANCTYWWTASGPIHTYMKRYKNFLVLERIPFEKKYSDEATLQHYRTFNVSTTGWRTTTDYKASEDYMYMAATLFGERAAQPRCPGGVCPPGAAFMH